MVCLWVAEVCRRYKRGGTTVKTILIGFITGIVFVAFEILVIHFFSLALAVAFIPIFIAIAKGSRTGVYHYQFNNSVGHAQKHIAQLFGRSRWEVKMISGSLSDEVYEAPEVKASIRDALARGVKIKIIATDDSVSERLKSPSSWTNHEFVTAQIIPGDWTHIITVDGLHTRIEHNSHGSTVTHLKATTRCFGHWLAVRADDYYEYVLNQNPAILNTQPANICGS